MREAENFFSSSLSVLPSVGEKTLGKLQKLGLYTLLDLLLHLPIRYEDRTYICPISEVKPEHYHLIEGEITAFSKQQRHQKRGGALQVQLVDESGERITIYFFHTAKRNNRVFFQSGKILRCFGLVKSGLYEAASMMHPEYSIRERKSQFPALPIHLSPIYSTTKGLSQNKLQNLIAHTLEIFQQNNSVDERVLLGRIAIQSNNSHYSALSLKEALTYLHKPFPEEKSIQATKLARARNRIVFEELLVYQMHNYLATQVFETHKAVPLLRNKLQSQLVDIFGFTLTSAQKTVIAEMGAALEASHPMLRLLQGDVGSGKTVVAACLAAQAIASSVQVAIMAPTEVLAMQLFSRFEQWFSALQIKVGYLAGSQRAKARREIYTELAEGKIQIVVGTHALLSEPVQFLHLGLVVIDEQHRFGVAHRRVLWEKGTKQTAHPHVLLMTATPIPRTLSLLSYAGLSHSVLAESPQGRLPILTCVLAESARDALIQRVWRYSQQGHQVYWVCTLIAASDVLEAQAAEAVHNELQEKLPDLSIGLLHGQMGPKEKAAIMDAFRDQRINLLVATTVVEVGVDIPNANVMVIENAERLGLAQLHQLRGRVGRGGAQGYCVLLHKETVSMVAKKRLQLLKETQDGFVLAEQDLIMRGPGERFGIKQSGHDAFRIACLSRDYIVAQEVAEVAVLLEQYANQEMLDFTVLWGKPLFGASL